MSCPEVEIRPGDSIEEADDKVAKAYRARGASLLAFEHLNTLLPTSSFCHFFQIELEGHRYVLVVNSKPWEESSILAVLNILLNIRMDPEPPGPPVLFRFHGAYPVAPVLLTLFGDLPPSHFECHAALVVGYATDIQPSQSLQLAAVAVHLLRECFGLRTGLSDPDGESVIGEAMTRWFSTQLFPEGGAPLNSIVTLGFLYGEIIRSRLPYLSRWVRIKDHSPWPVLVVGRRPDRSMPKGHTTEGARPVAPAPSGASKPALSEASRPASGEGAPASQDSQQIVFNPVATVISVYQGSPGSFLAEASEALARRCEEVLGTFDEN